jgi:two-component system, OmpR family, alkaline phosphatase synthesis response regulator PhoP
MVDMIDSETREKESVVNMSGVDLDEVYASERHSVLVIEDEPDTVTLLKHILRGAGFNVMGALSGSEALKKCADIKPDLVLLDLMMPDMDGWETYRYLRQMCDVPVIVISAVGNKDDVVRALRMGVDDFVTKPFYNAEVIARAQAVLRRYGKMEDVSRLVFPQIDFVIDFQTQKVTLKDQSVQLTNKEFAVLAVLARAAPEVVNYQTIAQQVWGMDTPDVRKRIKYLVYIIRRKFQNLDSERELIMNVDRLGYKLNTGEE